LRPDAKERVDSDSAWFRYEGEIVQITDISASPEREGWRRRVLLVSTNIYLTLKSEQGSQFRITIGDMGDILLDGHIGEFRNDNLESQEPAVSMITPGMLTID
jgi:hypothetical protein